MADPTGSHLPALALFSSQGQELTIRQISLLGFRDLVLLKVKLDDLLLLAQPQPPLSIIQMLLILQVSLTDTSLQTEGGRVKSPPQDEGKGPCGWHARTQFSLLKCQPSWAWSLFLSLQSCIQCCGVHLIQPGIS